MKLRHIVPIFVAVILSHTQAEERPKGIDHLVPPIGIQNFDSSWNYDARLRAILLKDAPLRPIAFALVRTGPGRPEFCVHLLRGEDGNYTVEARQPARHIWYDKSSERNPVETYRKVIPQEKGKEIALLWEKMLREVMQPTPDKKKGFLLDSISTYYACFIQGEGILAGETPNPEADRGDLAKMSSYTLWMAMDCMGDNFYNHDPQIRKALEKYRAEQTGAVQPATKPADKVPPKDQPSTPTSKDAPR